MKILMAIPSYNCAPQIERVIDKLSDSFLSLVSEVCFIDNCSSDNTIEIIQSGIKKLNRDNIKLFQNKKNYGLGGSFKQIVTHAFNNGFDYLLWFHGDDQADIEDAKELLSLLHRDSPDVIFGARFMKGSTLINYSKIRKWGNKFLNLIFSLVLKKRIFDLGSGLNIYKINSLPLAQIPFWPNHIAYDINLLLHYSLPQFKTIFYPIKWNQKDQKSNAKNFSVAFDALKILAHWITRKSLSISLNQEKRSSVEII